MEEKSPAQEITELYATPISWERSLSTRRFAPLALFISLAGPYVAVQYFLHHIPVSVLTTTNPTASTLLILAILLLIVPTVWLHLVQNQINITNQTKNRQQIIAIVYPICAWLAGLVLLLV